MAAIAARRASRALAACALIAVVITLQADNGSHGPAVACALLATALGMGEVTSAHRDTAAAAARHAHDMERARLARELHDVVTHQLSAIAVQAGAVRLAAAGDPQAAGVGIAAIERQARSGLTELNQLVRELQPTGDVGRAMPSQPRLADLPDLIERAGDSGLRAGLRVEGEPRPLPAAVELAGYRVVQESLTNAIRYAAGAAATVYLAYHDDGIVVEVTDDGPGALAPAPIASPVRPRSLVGAPDWPGSGSEPAYSAASLRPAVPQGEASWCARSCRPRREHPYPGGR